MTAPEHLRITGPEDILGFIPHSLGYWPEYSLVAMTLQGKQLGATLRVDLPSPGGGGGGSTAGGRSRAAGKRRPGSGRRDGLAGFARNVVSYLEADDAADGSLLAFFTGTTPGLGADTGAGSGDDDAAGSGVPVDRDDANAWAGLLAELELALEAAGMPLRDAWIVGTEFWRNAYCSDPECCGPAGRPVEQIKNSRLNAEMVFRGSSVGAAPGVDGARTQPLPVDPAIRAAESGWAAQFSSRRRDRAQFDQVLDVWTMAMKTMVMNQAAPDPRAGTCSAAASVGSDARTADSRRAESKPPVAKPADACSPGAGSAAPKILGWPLELSAELSGYLRASLCVPSWRDAVLVMAAAGRRAAERGAEDFGMFDIPAAPGLFPGTTPRPGPTSSPIPGATCGPPADKEPPDTLRTHTQPAERQASDRERPERERPAREPSDGQPADRRPGGSGSLVANAAPGYGKVAGYGEVLLGLAPSVPDWAMMDGLARVMELLGGVGDGEPTAAAVTARGWIEWCRGRGSYADALYRQALREQPGYRLAELLAELGGRGALCGWAARREAAWQKFAPDAA